MGTIRTKRQDTPLTTTTDLVRRITDALDTIRHGWPHMLPENADSESISPYRGKAGGRTSNPRGEDNGDHNDDVTRVDVILSTRGDITATLNGWARLILDDYEPDTPTPAGDNAVGLALYISANVLHLAGHVAAEDALEELEECAKQVAVIVDPPRRTTITLGACTIGGCQGVVRARPDHRDETTGDAWARCDTCDTEAVADWWRKEMGLTRRSELTTDEIVTLAYQEFGISLTHRAVQGLVRRKVLHPIEDTKPQAFQFAECVAYLTRRAG